MGKITENHTIINSKTQANPSRIETESIRISQITQPIISKPCNNYFAVCWIKNRVNSILIDSVAYRDVSNSIFFLAPLHEWTIYTGEGSKSCGYVLYITKEVLNNPLLSNLHINKVRLFNSGKIPLFQLSPGIEKRTQSILEMIDELLGSNLNHKEEAILSLLNTFFVYCDGQCNIKSIASGKNSKNNVVYSFKKLVDQNLSKHHDVQDYASMLHILTKYLGECVKEVLSVSPKQIIVEQLLIRARHEIKFSTKSLKEISFELGFSSPDYFSYFFKTHAGKAPSALRKA